MARAVEREGGTCAWCRRPFGPLVPPTTDHLVPRVRGGPSWLENEVAACRRCNAQRGHAGAADWVRECRGRGWEPDVEHLLAVLAALQGAVARRGGQRRAREAADRQARRLERLR
ncbi:HNH endonuclease [uncultured Pseudokineococcus sp.]|uniref:HNH endonuclease n=1 Tax=uncultured Pseudokineococcus sp. TaxID=1642928 RepID=UPI002614FEB9|nr:HNH endonuclease [uncultured Pseudokineococcus sp.]